MDTPAAAGEPAKPQTDAEEASALNRRPFGGLEFQVSEVVGRLEAGVNAQDAPEDEKKREPPKEADVFLEPDEMGMDDILKVLEELVVKTDPSCENIEPPLLPTDAVTRAAILSHSIAALFGRLERSHAARLGTHIAGETTLWMSHMFRLSDYQAYYHQEELEGLVRVTRMLLHHKYPRYLEDGAVAFTSRFPCIYSCVASPLGVVQHLCRQLGLPLACVRPVPVDPSGRGMDAEALARQCAADAAEGRTPLLALGEAGAPPLGLAPPLRALAAACTQHAVHLHLRGHALLVSALADSQQTFTIADSLTLTPGLWFGVPGLPIVTFYKIPEPIVANDVSKDNPTGAGGGREWVAGLRGGCARLPALPLWTALRAAGVRPLARRLRAALRATRRAYLLLSNLGLRVLSTPPSEDESPTADIVDVVSETSACVAFQFAPEDSEKPPPYYDKMNSWLGLVLQREADMISIEVCETESHGVVLRYCPLESGVILEEDRVEELAQALDTQLSVLRATLALRQPFRRRVQELPMLRLVRVPGWAGLGGVRYVPAGWEQVPARELDALNRQLVDELRATDIAFSAGESDEGLVCVRFGMVTADTDVDELLDLVVAAGKDVEDNSKVLSNMTEVLKKGIEEATLSLERESVERAWQEGLLRRVPVVGRVVGWWAPAAPPAPPPGRRLHLALGTLQTTDDVYRLVQKKHEESNTPARPHSPLPAPRGPQ